MKDDIIIVIDENEDQQTLFVKEVKVIDGLVEYTTQNDTVVAIPLSRLVKWKRRNETRPVDETN